MILALFFANSRSEPSDRVIFSLSVSRHTCHSDFFDIEKCCIKSLSRNEIKSIFETCNHWPTVCTRQPGLSSRHKTGGICLIFDWRGGRGRSWLEVCAELLVESALRPGGLVGEVMLAAT